MTFVSTAKNWYKQLPAQPPGAPMYSYIDPNAGRDRLRSWGHQVYRDRTENTERSYYSWPTTREYRRRFGYLALWGAEPFGGFPLRFETSLSAPPELLQLPYRKSFRLCNPTQSINCTPVVLN